MAKVTPANVTVFVADDLALSVQTAGEIRKAANKMNLRACDLLEQLAVSFLNRRDGRLTGINKGRPKR